MIHRDWNNREVAALLEQIAAAHEVKGEDQFRVRAYLDAADSILRGSQEVKDIWEDEKIEDIPGIGKSIAAHLDELFRTGKVKHFEAVKKNLPHGMFAILGIPNIGARTAHKLASHLGLVKEETAIGKLKEALRKGKVATIEGFGEDSQQRLLSSLEQWERREDRMLLPQATELAKQIQSYMQIPAAAQIEVLGSLRRRSPTVGDIDFAVATDKPGEVLAHFGRNKQWRSVSATGENTARAIHRSGRQIDMKTEPAASFGTLLAHFTGSKDHNVRLREYALRKGLSVSEHGVKITQNSKLKTQNYNLNLKTFRTEEGFYEYLGLEWIPPELREDRGEIEAAQRHQLPRLVEITDIRGDLHIHSDFNLEPSHDLGRSTLTEICDTAESMGYEYIAIADHNPSSSQHTENQILDLIKRRNEYIDKFISSPKNKPNIHIFKSLEIDILPSGKLAVPDAALELLDLAIISVHSSFLGSRDVQTKRVITAMEHPRVKIFGHPTGRQLLEREGVDYDWDKIFAVCRKNNIYLEINASPQRLDLPDLMVKAAIEAGIRFTLGTDSHQSSQMKFMQSGVDDARRGWAQAPNIVNTLGYNEARLRLLRG